jgi:hypothetical protein
VRKKVSDIGRLEWGIKDSLVRYIESLADGSITLTDSAELREAGFSFPCDFANSSYDSATATGILQFVGTVSLSGHWGALSISLSRPRLELVNGTGQLKMAQLGLFSSEPFYTFATVTAHDGPLGEDFAVELAPGGRAVMGEQYQVGQQLDTLRLLPA